MRLDAEIRLSWPLANMGPSLPNLLATVAGNFFLDASPWQLHDLSMPAKATLKSFPQ
jgi:ribulose-bisphosphate carboxylase large chain